MASKKTVLLAPNEQLEFDDSRIKYPLLGSVKYDGTRCLCLEGDLLSRSMKPQKNKNLPEALQQLVEISKKEKIIFDFELYDHTLPNHGAHTSILASHDKEIPDTLHCHIFDAVPSELWEKHHTDPDYIPFKQRYALYKHLCKQLCPQRYKPVEQVLIETAEEARMLFEISVEEGFEGLMLRCPNAGYKSGRATHNEGIIFKFKEFETVDGIITEVIQRRKLKEGIERTKTPTGHTERVHTKDSYELDEMVGAFRVSFPDGTESEVNYGRGFNHDVRKEHWGQREQLIGKSVEIRHLPHGAKDKIRIGTLVRFRPDKD